jgi:hypothetical protein
MCYLKTVFVKCVTSLPALTGCVHLWTNQVHWAEFVLKRGAGIAQWHSAGLRAGWWGFESRQGLGIFLFTTASRQALGPTQPPIQWVPGALSLGVKRPGREADHSPPSSAEVKNAWSYTSTPQYAFMAWCSVKAQEQLYHLEKLTVAQQVRKFPAFYGTRRFITMIKRVRHWSIFWTR